MDQSMCNGPRVVLRGTYIAVVASLKKEGKSQTNNILSQGKELEKEVQTGRGSHFCVTIAQGGRAESVQSDCVSLFPSSL